MKTKHLFFILAMTALLGTFYVASKGIEAEK